MKVEAELDISKKKISAIAKRIERDLTPSSLSFKYLTRPKETSRYAAKNGAAAVRRKLGQGHAPTASVKSLKDNEDKSTYGNILIDNTLIQIYRWRGLPHSSSTRHRVR